MVPGCENEIKLKLVKAPCAGFLNVTKCIRIKFEVNRIYFCKVCFMDDSIILFKKRYIIGKEVSQNQ
jgi:hypothetical protein